MEIPVVELSRKELYEEVWSISVAGVAKKYGIPYAKCMQQVKSAKIPIPPSGYWTKINFGKPVEQFPLQGDHDQHVVLTKEGFLQNPTEPNKVSPATSEKQLTTQRSTNKEITSDLESTEIEVSPQEEPKAALTAPEKVRQYGQTYNVYDREQLYQEVWTAPVTEVAKRYQVSDVTIHKFCTALDIPTPPKGYWAKLKAGKPVVKTPLLPNAWESKKFGLQTGISSVAKEYDTSLSFLPSEDRALVLGVAAQILLPDEGARMASEIIAHRKKIAEWKKQKRQQEREPWGGCYNRSRKEAPSFTEGISEEQLPRVFRIIDALAKAMTPLGCKLTQELRFTVNGETVGISFSESQTKVSHTPTKEENLKLLQYEEERKKHSWASKPNIRKYDYVYNGQLSMTIGGKSFRDCKSYVLEDRLGDMMLSIYLAAEDLRQQRLAREEEERRRREEAERKEEQRKRYNREVDRTLTLVRCAQDYETACRIRNYVSAMKQTHTEESSSEWAEWALAKADWFDPTVEKDDEFFGQRDHSASAEEKQLKHKSWW